MTQNLAQDLTRRRASIKQRVTIFENYLDRLTATIDGAKGSVGLENGIELRRRLKTVEELLTEYNDVQNQIEASSTVEAFEVELGDREIFETKYFKALARAKAILKQNNSDASDSSSVRSTHNSNRSSRTGVINQPLKSQAIKLPTINLPSFGGGFETWLEFRDTYTSLIHENEQISDIQKYHYLRSALSGEAAQVIKSIEFSEASYACAWDALCSRYNNTRMLINNHIKSPVNLDSIQKESSNKLRAMSNNIAKHLKSLETLNANFNVKEALIIYLASLKLDPGSHEKWQECQNTAAKTGPPTLSEFQEFLSNRANFLETLEAKGKPPVHTVQKKHSFLTHNTSSSKCSVCKGPHNIFKCENFLKLSVQERIDKVSHLKICNNCMRGKHSVKDCRGGTCRQCGAKHHTLLHIERGQNLGAGASSTLTSNLAHQHTLLPTAVVKVADMNGEFRHLRAILDSGSQSSFITETACESLGIRLNSVNLSVSGLNLAVSQIKSKCKVTLKSRNNSFQQQVSCLVIPTIISSAPDFKFDVSKLKIPKNIAMADPKCGSPAPVDMLLGSDYFWELLCVGQIRLGKDLPILQKTKLGWILSGPLHVDLTRTTLHCGLVSKFSEVQDQIQKFWQIEEGCLSEKVPSQDDVACENHFQSTTKRENGRFVVSVPLRGSPCELGDSKQNAIGHFQAIERKLAKSPQLKSRYHEFMAEYERLGHMQKVEDDNAISYYMPHFGITRESSESTKLRVVFNASAPTTTGKSYNDIQLVGPTIQNDLVSILVKFRKHTYVMAADVEKMFRQVWIQNDQRSLQRIVWRADSSLPISIFQLNTITYGTASAPFLAVRCLAEIANIHADEYPKAAKIIHEDFYVDDMLTGAETIEEARSICRDVSTVLEDGCFPLRKWMSNEPKTLEPIEPSRWSSATLSFDSDSETLKTLGLGWSAKSDSFVYEPRFQDFSRPVTKRSILSEISKIFDPLGLLGPAIIIAKILIQELWQAKISWDESIPTALYSKWIKFKTEFTQLNQIKIPRHVLISGHCRIELHGFSDASESAYGGCIYLKSVDADDNVKVVLLIAKSKVAPLKTITIPKLELCAAELLSKLFQKVIGCAGIKVDRCVFWCDSTIVLAWIKTKPHLLKTFVGNRVTNIQKMTTPWEWHHVSTHNNPADYISRGITPNNLKNTPMWWQGPTWLSNSIECSEFESPPEIHDLPELRSKCLTMTEQTQNRESPFDFDRFSSLTRLERVVAYCLRFIGNARLKSSKRTVTPLSASEINRALVCLVKLSQRDSFSEEIANLQKSCPNFSTQLAKLNPFLDSDGTLRVGGRLHQSAFCHDKKNPLLISSKHRLAELILQRLHIRLLHAGPQMVLATSREQFWITSGRNLCRKIVQRCVPCTRFAPKLTKPIMGDLPSRRLEAVFPFQTSGVDYAGPLTVKDRKGRGSKTSKCYICLFICFSTKAVHLELVSSLSTECFMLALRRFVSRRGIPQHIYSDNGTNFVGARSALRELGSFLKNHSDKISGAAADRGITWQFIPSHSPHFGGLWEAGVKSAKHHMKRVMGNAVLTFEELGTCLAQIESILNSRPLTPISSNPTDLTPLTPAHFLIGRPLVSVPDPDVTHLPESRLSRFQRIQQITQHLWTRWHKEYVSELQHRMKWTKHQSQLQLNTLVLIKDDQLPPQKWKLGRVVRLYPDQHGVSRVADIKTAGGIIRRSFAKICPLPVE